MITSQSIVFGSRFKSVFPVEISMECRNPTRTTEKIGRRFGEEMVQTLKAIFPLSKPSISMKFICHQTKVKMRGTFGEDFSHCDGYSPIIPTNAQKRF